MSPLSGWNMETQKATSISFAGDILTLGNLVQHIAVFPYSSLATSLIERKLMPVVII